MSYRLFLDDERDPYKVTWIELPLGPWQIVRSYDEFVKLVSVRGIPEHVSYDHDLGPQAMAEITSTQGRGFDYGNINEKTGLDCAKYLVELCIEAEIPHPAYTVHSMNPIGAESIASYIESYNKFKS